MAAPQLIEWDPTDPTAYTIVSTLTEPYLDTARGTGDQNPNWTEYGVFLATSPTRSSTKYQVLAYWSSSNKLVLAVRDVASSSFTEYVYDGTGGLANIAYTVGDSHRTICVDVSDDGIIHVWYDMHSDSLKYRQSTVAIESFAGTLSSTMSLLGTNESQVTYVFPFRNNDDSKLYCLLRAAGGAGNANTYLYEYDSATWSAGPGTSTNGLLLDGTGPSPDVSYYTCWPIVSDADDIYIAGHIRLAGTGTNYDPFLLWYDTSATTWKQMDGTSQTIPATPTNLDLIWDHSGTTNAELGFGLVHSFDVDSSGNPHCLINDDRKTMWDSTGATDSIAFYTRWNGSAWTQPIPASPAGRMVVINRATDILYNFCFDETADVVRVQTLASPYETGDYTFATIMPHLARMYGIDQYQWRDNTKYQAWAFIPATHSPSSVPTSPASWYHDDWSDRVRITIPASQVDANCTNLPVLVDLSHADLSGHDFWSTVDSTGKDIRITQSDGRTECPIELVAFNAAGETGELWFNPHSTLSASADNTFYMYYGNASAVAYNNQTGHFGAQWVWAPWYSYVYHGQTDLTDSAWHPTTTTENGTLPNVATGQIGSGQDFDGSTDYARITHASNEVSLDFGSGDFCIEAWAATTSTASEKYIVQKGNISASGQWWALLWNGVAEEMRFFLDDGTDTATAAYLDGDINDGTLRHFVGQRSGNDSEVYVNGAIGGTVGNATSVDSIDNTIDMVIGARTVSAGGFPPTAFWDGVIDEIRINRRSRPSTWWSTQYNNQSSPGTFMSIATEATNKRLLSNIEFGSLHAIEYGV